MSRTESGLGQMSGSSTNEGLKGSDVGTRSQDEDGQELRRRRFFEHAGRSRRPALHRRNAEPTVPRTSITAVVETIVDVSGHDENGKTDRRLAFRRGAASTQSSYPEQLTVPAVPKFPTFSNPTVPTVPAYPFNTPSPQSVLSSPPPSPVPTDVSFTPTSNPGPSASSSPESSLPSNNPSESSNSSNTATPPTAASTMNVSYVNTTSETATRSDRAASTSLIASSDRTTFSTRTSGSLPESTPGSTVAGAAATLTPIGTAPVSIETSGSSSDPSNGSSGPVAPNTPQVVGGVVGGIAGLAVILLVLLFLLRRYRRQLQDRGELLEPDESGRDATNTTSMRSSHTPLVTAVTASFNKMRPGSSRTTATGDTGTSDRGFRRVAGRKIEPVLVTGGDGYGGNYGAFEEETDTNKETGAPSSLLPEAQPLAGTSFYRDTTDFDSRHGSGTSTPTGGQTRYVSDNRDFASGQDNDYNRGPSPDAIAVMRPSPARSPVTTSAGPNQLAPRRPGPPMASDAPPTPTLRSRFIVPDGVGRSLVSQDGSRGSRFTESV